MRNGTVAFAVALAAFALSSCQTQPENAPAGSAAPVSFPVGPIPGQAEQPKPRLNPYPQDRIALTQGRQFFLRYNCYGCHGGHGGGGMGPSLRDDIWIYGSADSDVFDSIAQGRAHGMPSWGEKVPQDQIWKLTAYIKSMRTPQEPDPPEQK